MTNKLSRALAVSVLAASLSVAASAQAVTGIISLPDAPNGAQGIAINVHTNRVYAVAPTGNGVSDNLAVIDGSADALLTNITVPLGAQFVAVDTRSHRVYVAGCDFTASPVPCQVTSIDGRRNEVIKTVLLTTTSGFGITGIVVNSARERVYVANGSDNVIDILDGEELEREGSISLNGNSPFAIAINPVLNLLYVPYIDNQTGNGNQIATVDATRKKILATTTVGSGLLVGAAVNLRHGHVFVTDQETGPSLTAVLRLDGDLITTTTVGDAPLGVDVDPVTNLVFVASTQEEEVQVLSGSTYAVTATVPGIAGNYLAVNPVTKKVYVTGIDGVTVMTEQ